MKVKRSLKLWKSMCCLRLCCFNFQKFSSARVNMFTKKIQCSLSCRTLGKKLSIRFHDLPIEKCQIANPIDLARPMNVDTKPH